MSEGNRRATDADADAEDRYLRQVAQEIRDAVDGLNRVLVRADSQGLDISGYFRKTEKGTCAKVSIDIYTRAESL